MLKKRGKGQNRHDFGPLMAFKEANDLMTYLSTQLF